VGDGYRTLKGVVSKLVMACDFWCQGFESQPLIGFCWFTGVPCNPHDSTGVLETFWRRATKEPLGQAYGATMVAGRCHDATDQNHARP
jgi:hypothetical protein